jgi:hypothetical protein
MKPKLPYQIVIITSDNLRTLEINEGLRLPNGLSKVMKKKSGAMANGSFSLSIQIDDSVRQS